MDNISKNIDRGSFRGCAKFFLAILLTILLPFIFLLIDLNEVENARRYT